MKLRILLCDDASFIRDLTKRTLRKFLPQSEIMEAGDGRRAQTLISRQSFDLVISDWEMPHMSGEDLVRWIRNESEHKELPFLMVSSLGDKSHIVKAVDAGVSDYLGKPFSPEDLMHKVTKLLRKSGKLTAGQSDSGMSSRGSGGPFSSVDILSGKRSSQSAGQADASPLLSGNANTANERGSKAAGTAIAKISDHSVKCMIKSITLQDLVLITKRSDYIPELFSSASLTISLSQGSALAIQDIPAYLHAISAVEKNEKSGFIQLVFRFRELPANATESISEWLSRQRR
ncbi:two-component system response regulator [Pseudohongiella nitratireducens]|jgi:DNA-binding response OmpR family regulator|uniref:Two-component system response regulator n=1 Tax=Pseudohongiella nitratireducens TaxID=1768907 RepID=A0A917GVU8_9GAMM|nr:response regulator [Pseudohongiella nitratireducens]GGG58658.1 two-component system response regulator [Pseudohongiella nitratireducens]|tara:strand:+ start:2655 stop:3521 length:867 start_codon:yes stop_codon:yes gene_type:complete